MKNLVLSLLLVLMAVDFAFFCHCRHHNPACNERPAWLRRLLAALGTALALGLWIELPGWLELLLTTCAVLVWRKCCRHSGCRCGETP